MVMSSFGVPCPCPCPKCGGKKVQNLIHVGPGQWVCPESGDHVVTNKTEQDRAKRDQQKATKGARQARKESGA
jgi:uncharacterized Zn finger protein (UPF0148 family)